MPRSGLRSRPSWLPELLWILATALVATIVATLDLKLWKMHAHVPIFSASGDGAYYLATVKDVAEHGWFWHNPDLGAPFGQANYDFAAPFGDLVHYVIVEGLAVVLGDPVLVFNAFFLLSFPLVAVVAYAVMRDLGAAPVAALVAGVLFAFLPYHVLRNQSHLFLTAYYSIPLAVWLAVSLAEGRTLLGDARRRTLLAVGACIVVGAASNYYAVFAMIVLLTVVPVAAIARRSPRIALQGLAVTALVAATFALCHAPALVYPLVHGANDNVAEREPRESELFGLKLAYMVIPRPQHRVAFMARRGEEYSRATPLRSEGFDPSLGTIATLGLIAAIIILLSTGLGAVAASVRRRRIAAAGAVALASFVVGTIGGISTLIAYELTPQVRAWNRLSLVIAFASLLAVALLLTALGDRLRARGRPAWLLGVLAAAVGIVGVLDQTSPRDAPDYAAVAAAWKVDGDFAAMMQDRFPAGTKVLQLPYMSYPENGPVLGVADYDLLKGYLHSTGLRWSYGAVRGRPSDWLAQHPGLAPDQLAACAAAAGFGAVYVDRAGYPDGGAAIVAALEKLAGPGTSAASADGRLQFFDLRPAAARLAQRTPAAERAQVSDALLYPVMVAYGDGFSYQEITGSTIYRWAGADARVKLENPLRGTRTVTYTAQLLGGGPTPPTVTMTLPDGTRRSVRVDADGRRVRVRLRLRHGDATMRLQTAGPAAPTPPGNVRDLRLRVQEQTIEYDALAGPRLASYVAAATP